MRYEIKEALPILEKLLIEGKLNIFIGSGISIDSGIPTWNGLIEQFIDMARHIRFVQEKDKKAIHEICDMADKRKASGRFNPIEIATVLKNRLRDSIELTIPQSQAYKDYHNWIGSTFGSNKANQKHIDIVSTNYKYILTSNYDDLLQSAAYDVGHIRLSGNTFSFKNQTEIIKLINNEQSAIIHVHGIVNNLEIDELIFAKEDYNKIILKKYEGFSFALRMLFTRYSTLFVGYGASDPHLEEVLEELAEYFPLIDSSYSLPESFLITLRDKADIILEKYKERVGTNLILIDDFDQYNNLLSHLKNIQPR
ncbi:SIR2 family protein [Dokdonia sp.]|uniref:SIR2 family protein n=1 Tax=Dokdonia sp. TaxID=2024995 RepID=UPI00326414BB